MKFSGWARLWIVASVIWWSSAGIWIAFNVRLGSAGSYPNYYIADYMPLILPIVVAACAPFALLPLVFGIARATGWVRFWIVASLIWWGAGGWWLAASFRPTIGLVEAVDTDQTGTNDLGAYAMGGNAPNSVGGPDNPIKDPDVAAILEARIAKQKDRASLDLRSSLMQSTATPDQAATDLETAGKVGVSRFEVEQNRKDFDIAALANEIDKLSTYAPHSYEWMMAHTDNLEVAKDATQNLSWLLALALVIAAPFCAALAFIGVRATGRWIWRGFRLPPSTVGQTVDVVAQSISPTLLPERDAAMEARTDARAKVRREPKSGTKPDARESNRQGRAEKLKKRGVWASIGIVFAVLLVGVVAQFVTSLTKAVTAPAIEAVLPKLSALAPSTIEPLAPGVPRAPDGFTRVTLEDGAIRFDAPSAWPLIDTAIFAEADTIAASMLGTSGGERKVIYSAAVSPSTGMEPAATLHVFLEKGPAPTQQQVREKLAQRNPAIVDLPKKTAAYFSEIDAPNVTLLTRLAEWADNGKLLCLHIQVELAGDRTRKISDQWNCYNSSGAVTLTSVYDAGDTAIYAPILQHVFNSLDLALDHTVRLR